MNRRIAGVLVTAAVAAGAYALLIEPRLVQRTRSRIHIRDLPPDLEGLRIALLTDLHAGGFTPMSVLRRATRLAMDAQPHLVAIAGDLIDDHHGDMRRALDALEGLTAPLGVYVVPGNHDHVFGDIGEWHRAIRRHPVIEDLTNRSVIRRLGEANLCMAGVDDLDEGAPQLRLPPRADRDITILLAHNPDHGERTRRSIDDVDLVLAGHTHGGQLRVPGLGAIERKSDVYDAGLLRRPWTQVYTSRGIGTTKLPLRFGARPEVAVLELTGAPRQRWTRSPGPGVELANTGRNRLSN